MRYTKQVAIMGDANLWSAQSLGLSKAVAGPHSPEQACPAVSSSECGLVPCPLWPLDFWYVKWKQYLPPATGICQIEKSQRRIGSLIELEEHQQIHSGHRILSRV